MAWIWFERGMTVYRSTSLADLPRNHYQVVLADPPWRFLTRSEKGLGKSPDRHYRTMTLDEVKALPVRDVCAKNAVLFLWIIDTHAEMAFEVVKAWGFKYKTVGLYWAKTTKDGKSFPIGTGYWTRANPEHALEAWQGDEQEVERCILATGGAPKRQDKNVPRLMVSPRREHSRKPDETLARVERLVKGPYLEMFSRTDRPGWDCWGNQAGMFQDRLHKLPALSLEASMLLGFGDDLDAIAEALI
jgi:N6-adenosine-specific RNA methylase IME4